METSIKAGGGGRKLAVMSVLATVGTAMLAAVVLPPAAADVLPVLALLLPFIAAGVVDCAVEPTGEAHA